MTRLEPQPSGVTVFFYQSLSLSAAFLPGAQAGMAAAPQPVPASLPEERTSLFCNQDGNRVFILAKGGVSAV